jgi:hypothetical protein
MMNKIMDTKSWRLAQGLAAELALRGTDRSLINEALNYLRAYPQADFFDWLEKLMALGDLFTLSKQTAIYRCELRDACQRLHSVADNQTLAQILGWAARLHSFYWQKPDLALHHSPVRPETLREGDIVEGLVRSEIRRKRGGGPARLVVEIGPGQFAVLSEQDKARYGLEVGDKVEVEIRGVHSLFQFGVIVLKTLEQIRPAPAPPDEPAQGKSPQPPVAADQSELVDDIMAWLRKKGEEGEH